MSIWPSKAQSAKRTQSSQKRQRVAAVQTRQSQTVGVLVVRKSCSCLHHGGRIVGNGALLLVLSLTGTLVGEAQDGFQVGQAPPSEVPSKQPEPLSNA